METASLYFGKKAVFSEVLEDLTNRSDRILAKDLSLDQDIMYIYNDKFIKFSN